MISEYPELGALRDRAANLRAKMAAMQASARDAERRAPSMVGAERRVLENELRDSRSGVTAASPERLARLQPRRAADRDAGVLTADADAALDRLAAQSPYRAGRRGIARGDGGAPRGAVPLHASPPVAAASPLNALLRAALHPPPPGAAFARALARLPAARGEDDDCSICLGSMEDRSAGTDVVAGALIALPRCAHRFHRGCIARWFARRQTCPLCLRDVHVSNGGSTFAMPGTM